MANQIKRVLQVSGAAMSSSVNQARAMVRALVKHGVRQAVVSPGSRNAPLSMALAQADAAGLLKMYTRIDERTTAFTALGMAKRQFRPVVAITTSGTAAAHLAAAAWEASEAGVPLILITADRPPELRDRGANQTILQEAMFGDAVRAEWDLPLATSQPDDLYWELAIANAIQTAMGDDFTAPGAVHLNVPFVEPLVPSDFESGWLDGAIEGDVDLPKEPEPVSIRELLKAEKVDPENARGVIFVSSPLSAAAAIKLGRQLQWPVLAEPGSNARTAGVGIQNYATAFSDPETSAALQADVVITAGRFGLSRSVNRYVQNASLHIAAGKFPLDADPFASAKHHILQIPEADIPAAPAEWLELWHTKIPQPAAPNEWGMAAAIYEIAKQTAAGDLVWFAASRIVRIADGYWPVDHPAMQLMNRGTNGIDGLIASATGASLVHQGQTRLLIGDIAYLHDLSSLALPNTETKPNLQIIVFNNHEGQIFRGLEQGADEYENVFDRAFGTPQHHNLSALATALGWESEVVSNLSELTAAVSKSGPRVIVVEL
jgi:2-succinyl-5-enolpyruvyl-6-hydroxy-3-cyclohexene-1-carboxylate synthase